MSAQHPIPPPPELVRQWTALANEEDGCKVWNAIATQAAQWGADQELDKSNNWLVLNGYGEAASRLRDARRPQPPSLKEQAIAALSEMSIEPCLINDVDVNAAVCAKYNTIRRALEALDD
jgi:hypothetical protein